MQDLFNSGAEGSFRCVYVNVESGLAFREDTSEAMRAIIGALASSASEAFGDGFVEEVGFDVLERFGPGKGSRAAIADACVAPACCQWGGGRIEREHATGRDVRICRFSGWSHSARMQRFVIERKILHGSLETDIARGLEQIAGSMDTSAAQEGHLVIFDRDKKLWQDRVFHRSEVVHGKLIESWGM